MTGVAGLTLNSPPNSMHHMLTVTNSTTGSGPSSTSSPTSSSSSSSCASSSTTQHQHHLQPSSTPAIVSSTSSSGKQILNSSTVKMLHAQLEEASQTGELLLSGKNLNEFPAKLAAAYDLSDTLTADLSKNHLLEFPRELVHCDSLERLHLQSNQIRLVGEITPYQLRCLRVLDLNSNSLAYLPPSLCNLGSLQVLTINNNKLVSLPEEIGSLTKLIQLDVSCNEITHLPIQLGDLTALRSLNVRRNLLVELPKEIAQLKLVSFDCSSNRLSKLPLCFRDMVTLIDLVVDHNPLELPPAHVCTKGLLHIMKYLLVEALREEKRRGILSEYEINTHHHHTQYNSISYNMNQQRLSCSNSVSAGITAKCGITMAKVCHSSSSSTASKSSSTSSSSTSLVCPPPASILLNKQNSVTLKPETHHLDEHLSHAHISPSSSPISTHSSSSSSNTSLTTTTVITNPSLNKTSLIQTHKIQEPSNSKLVSIHELITNKPMMNQNQMSTTAANNKSNRNSNSSSASSASSEHFTLSAHQIEDEQQWKMNEFIQNKRMQDNLMQKCNEVASVFNNKMPLQTGKQQVNPIPMTTQFNKQPPQQHVMYDESLNPVVMFNNENFIVPNQQQQLQQQTRTINKQQPSVIYRSNSQEYMQRYCPADSAQQQIWVPRDESVGGNVELDDGTNLGVAADEDEDPTAFTIKRHLIQLQEEQKQVEVLKKIIEQKLKVQLPQVASVEELGVALADGVILCHLMNQIFPRAIQVIHVPSLALPKLSLAKCRKNVENFIDACRRLGLPENDLCMSCDIIEAKNTAKIARTCIMLVNYNQYIQQQQIELEAATAAAAAATAASMTSQRNHQIPTSTATNQQYHSHHHHPMQQLQPQPNQTQQQQQQTAV